MTTDEKTLATADEDTTPRFESSVPGARTDEQRADDQREATRTGQRAEGAAAFDQYDLMTLDELDALAKERGVKILDDVWKAHMVTELRAHQSGARPGQG